MKKRNITFLIAACVGIMSCQPTCGIVAEPTLSLNFVSMLSPKFTKIKIIGTTKDLPNSNTATPSLRSQYGNIFLPIDLNSTSTTYVFEQPNRTDTLTVFYRVVIKKIDLYCGNFLDIDSTATKPKSTFKKVSVDYGTYYTQRTFFGYTGGTGLNVNVTEL